MAKNTTSSSLLANKKNLIAIVAALVILLGVIIGFMSPDKAAVSAENTGGQDHAAHGHDHVSAASDNGEAMAVEEKLEVPPAKRVEVAIKGVSTIGAIAYGSADAPVVIHEFSSYTCGHCGSFHQNAFKDLVRYYVNTDQAYMLVSDFPLNLPALEASMIVRCVPEERVFNYSKLLFENQNDWAYEQGYQTYLKQNAQFAGLSIEQSEACLSDEALRGEITQNAAQAQEVYDIRSTPSFVLYHRDAPQDFVVITGAQKFEVFQEAINKLLKQ